MKLLLALALLIAPASSQTATLVWQGGAGMRTIALTFDAGADRGYAARILQILERNRVRVSFGMTGRWAENNPDLIHRMARDQDAFINHTYDHRSFTGLSSNAGPLTTSQRVWEITHAEQIIRRLTGHSPKPYFRPPYGDYDAATLTLVRQLGYRYVIMWTIDSLGWNHLPAAAIQQRVLSLARPGAIVVMHVGIQSQDALALQTVIRSLKSRGYRLVTVPQLLASR